MESFQCEELSWFFGACLSSCLLKQIAFSFTLLGQSGIPVSFIGLENWIHSNHSSFGSIQFTLRERVEKKSFKFSCRQNTSKFTYSSWMEQKSKNFFSCAAWRVSILNIFTSLPTILKGTRAHAWVIPGGGSQSENQDRKEQLKIKTFSLENEAKAKGIELNWMLWFTWK